MNEIQKSIRRVFWLYFALFAALALYLGKLIFFDSAALMLSPLNPRLALENGTLIRGDILDDKGEILATSEPNRVYPFGADFAHLVGFVDYQKAGLSGVEFKYNDILQTAHNEILQRTSQFMEGGDVKGNSLALTVNADLQQFIARQLGERKGSVLILEPSTGKIKAMASYPAFDPNDVHENWEMLESDTDGSPLLNRASQGLYPPGSVFKIVTASAAYEHIYDLDALVFDCAGETTKDGKTIHCFGSAVHGEETIQKAFAVSCNTFFADAGLKMGAQALRDAAKRLYFNETIPYPLEYSVSSFSMEPDASVSEIMETAIGQGKTMTSPLHMALITAAVANRGVMMTPYVVDHVLDYERRVIKKTMPALMNTVFTSDEANRIASMMTETMLSGTGKQAAVEGPAAAAKTGSAENPQGDDHGWFVAFAPVENPQFVLCIMLENIGGSSKTLGMAKEIIHYLFTQP